MRKSSFHERNIPFAIQPYGNKLHLKLFPFTINEQIICTVGRQKGFWSSGTSYFPVWPYGSLVVKRDKQRQGSLYDLDFFGGLKISNNRACLFIHVIVQQLRYQYPLLYQRKSTKAACFRNSASGWLMNDGCCWHFCVCIFFDSHRISQQFTQKSLYVVLIIQIHALQ